MHQIKHSTKTVKPLQELIGNKRYIFPKEIANERDPQTGKSSVMVIVNGKQTFLPVEEPIEIPPDVFALLKDIGIIREDYQTDKDFNPFIPVFI